MSHPILVDVAATSFIPAVVHNNTEGDAHARVRERFEETAWNNPVVRIVRADDEVDLVPRVTDKWTRLALADAMVRALTAAKKDVPPALELLRAEESAQASGVETAIFGMT